MSMPAPISKPRRRLTARDYVLYLLGRRDYSERELRQRLARRECTAEDIEDALRFVQEQGLQSDSRYAAARTRMLGRTRGNRRIRQALGLQGISADEATQQIDQLPAESERAIRAVARFSGQGLDVKARGRIWRFLAFRGFSQDAIRAALAHLATELKIAEQEVEPADGR